MFFYRITEIRRLEAEKEGKDPETLGPYVLPIRNEAIDSDSSDDEIIKNPAEKCNENGMI